MNDSGHKHDFIELFNNLTYVTCHYLTCCLFNKYKANITSCNM